MDYRIRVYVKFITLTRVLASASLLGLLFIILLPDSALGQRLATANPINVKAAYLRNFAHYVTWPSNAFDNDGSPWCIAVLGEDPFGDVLEKTFQGRSEQQRTFEIFRADTPEELPRCQIIVVTYEDDEVRRSVLAEMKNKPVLTVGDAPEFLQEGGIIRFQVDDRVQMSINLDQARAVSIKIQSQMLEVSRAVLEDGEVRKLR